MTGNGPILPPLSTGFELLSIKDFAADGVGLAFAARRHIAPGFVGAPTTKSGAQCFVSITTPA
jgi:hypothetical protein